MTDAATNPPEQPRSVKSMDELARIMAENRAIMRGETTPQDDPKPNEGTDDDQDDTAGIDDGEEEDEIIDDDSQGDDSDEAADADSDEDGDEDEQTPADDDAEDLEEEEIVLSDDDLIEIEGLDKPITLKQLKDVYQSDDAIVQKVAEADDRLQKASQSYSKASQDAEQLLSAMRHVVEQVDKVLSVPIINKPDAALKQSNPQLYIQHLEAYEQDQARIADSRQAVLDTINQFDNQRKEKLNGQRAFELARLAEKLPTLRDNEKKVHTLRDIAVAAQHYGFTPEELQGAADHRLLLMAYDAQQYRKLKSGSKDETTQEEREKNLKRVIRSQPKPLRSGNTQPPSRAKLAQKKVRVVKAKAQSTGRPEDVAAFMSQRRQVS